MHGIKDWMWQLEQLREEYSDYASYRHNNFRRVLHTYVDNQRERNAHYKYRASDKRRGEGQGLDPLAGEGGVTAFERQEVEEVYRQGREVVQEETGYEK